MMSKRGWIGALLGLVIAAVLLPAVAQKAPLPVDKPPPVDNVVIEIYRIAPGQHEAFLEEIARYDEANRLAGLPPRQLYVHSDGASWDFVLIQPAKTPPDKEAALDAAWKKLGLPSGADFFLSYRRFIADHSDTVAIGPTSAAAYLSTRTTKH